MLREHRQLMLWLVSATAFTLAAFSCSSRREFARPIGAGGAAGEAAGGAAGGAAGEATTDLPQAGAPSQGGQTADAAGGAAGEAATDLPPAGAPSQGGQGGEGASGWAGVSGEGSEGGSTGAAGGSGVPVCATVSGMATHMGLAAYQLHESAAETFDGDDTTYYGSSSACSKNCGDQATITTTYEFSAPIDVKAVQIRASAETSAETSFGEESVTVTLTMGNGKSETVKLFDFTGSWTDVTKLRVSIATGYGGTSGGKGSLRLYEVRVTSQDGSRISAC